MFVRANNVYRKQYPLSIGGDLRLDNICVGRTYDIFGMMRYRVIALEYAILRVRIGGSINKVGVASHRKWWHDGGACCSYCRTERRCWSRTAVDRLCRGEDVASGRQNENTQQ